MTKIEWTNETWNPVIGCSKVSEGCENCYAERMAARLAYNPVTPMYSDVMRQPSMMSGRLVWNGTTAFVESALNKPLKRKKPTMFFVCSMGDFWHPSVEPEWRGRVYDVVRKCPQHIFQFLTKRPELIIDWPADLSNSWLGATAENQAMADKRIPILKQIPAAVRFVSVEPLLEGVEIPDTFLRKLDWVIVGCESGADRRPCRMEWVESVVDQCKAAGVPVFVKQLAVEQCQSCNSTYPEGTFAEHETCSECGHGRYRTLISKDPSEWPEHLRVRQWPENFTTKDTKKKNIGI